MPVKALDWTPFLRGGFRSSRQPFNLFFQLVPKEAAMRFRFVLTAAVLVLMAGSCAEAAQTPGEAPGQASAWIPKDEFIRQEKAFMDNLVLLDVGGGDSVLPGLVRR
ncbi:MAG: hypothetical protein IKX75_07095, partial [Desulfovibrio sp.]|nr:hypothetical protein [Desulfovibrio sp.]